MPKLADRDLGPPQAAVDTDTTLGREIKTVIPQVEYREVEVDTLGVKGAYDSAGRFKVGKVVLPDEEEVDPSPRFWHSLCARFGFGPSIYKYFSHEEVFNRVSEVMRQGSAGTKKDRVRLCIQRTPSVEFLPDEDQPEFSPTLLAVSGLDAAMMFDDQLRNVLVKNKPEALAYNRGLVITRHKLKRAIDFDIGGDIHRTSMSLETPLDGYGRPNIYLAMIRQVCTNGAIAYAKAFRSGITLGKGENAPFALLRALDAFNNEDGFTAMKMRLESAQKSQASVFEVQKLAKIVWEISNADFSDKYCRSTGATLTEESNREYTMREPLLERLVQRSGDLQALYGVAQLDSISEKRQRALPTKCRVYDLLNFATELATHQMKAYPAKRLQAFFGDMIAKEYDIEGSEEAGMQNWDDFIEPSSRFSRDFSDASVN